MTDDAISEIFALFERFGGLGYGEHVSQLSHMLQSAHFAREAGEGDAMIAAALLHDVGQFINDAGEAAGRNGVDARHEVLGAAYLARAFPPEITEAVRLHVDAKRYLCVAEPGYEDSLSAASKLSLKLQGGPFTADEAAAFREQPYAEEAIRLRRYDDLGKQPDLAVMPLGDYRRLLANLIR